MNISTNPKEKLTIKFDYANFWKGQQPEVVLLNKYGFIESVITNPADQVLVQKLAAYVQRNITQPRDMYDIVWLVAQGAKFDKAFAKSNGFEGLLAEAKAKFSREGVPEGFKTKLAPFLFNPDEVRKLELLGKVLETL